MNHSRKCCSVAISRKIHLNHWSRILHGLTFLLHFFTVMTILFFGAVVLAILEDPEVLHDHNSTLAAEEGSILRQEMNETIDRKLVANNDDPHGSPQYLSLFWKATERKYNFSISDELQASLWSHIRSYIEHEQDVFIHHQDAQVHRKEHTIYDREFILMKWFYFVVVASTTIGYGHIHPKTDRGKTFYIFFSIFSIILMMTLLRSCGKILMLANKKVYTVIRKRILFDRRYASDELISVITLCVMFGLFMVLVVWHDKNISEVKHWSMVDTIYFWLVTFTTVGFGDIHFPLKVEIEHFYELLLYRVFGLSFLAAIIESIYVYFRYRRLILIEKSTPRLRKVAQVMVGSINVKGKTINGSIV